VFPLDNRGFERILLPRPSGSPGLTEFTYTSPISIALGAEPPYLGRDFTIPADIEIPADGAEGMLITQGGRFNGYGLYLLKGRPVFTYNALDLRRFRWEGAKPLAPGKHTVVFEFTYDRPGLGKGGTGVLKVDGGEVARQTIPHTTPIIQSFDEGLDVGFDTRIGVDDRDYRVPFRFTGTIAKVTFKPGPPQFTPEEEKRAAAMRAKALD